ncbi:hypothetical protein OIU77_026418 [Salix suchowensis]|uniref:Uncharacterized protein n=1 Tax=Salix suchowensis TaxID=1278906 RepID=A0ABQ9BN67_9ROSI|nr:hypothetical protein OIU77_026418 [Salix suchowensis]
MRPATGKAGRRRSRLPQESCNRRQWWRLPWTAGEAAVVEERELSWTVEMVLPEGGREEAGREKRKELRQWGLCCSAGGRGSEDSGGRTGSGSGRQMVKGRSGGWKKERGGKRLAGGTDERKREWGQAGRRD